MFCSPVAGILYAPGSESCLWLVGWFATLMLIGVWDRGSRKQLSTGEHGSGRLKCTQRAPDHAADRGPASLRVI